MKQTWRWFGPHDTVSTNNMSQAGVEGVVTALHHIPNGTTWSLEEIKKRQIEISLFIDKIPSSLTWDVVESLPVSEEIKQQSGDWRTHIENYKQSIRNLATCGISTVCYNFMPILDWTRTNLAFELHNGATCMRFDIVDFAVFDIHILKRVGAENEFSKSVKQDALIKFSTMTDVEQKNLVSNIICGLPGAEQGYTLENIKQHLARYDSINEQVLRKHQIDFLSEVLPTAEQVGVRLCCHPDDPPLRLVC